MAQPMAKRHLTMFQNSQEQLDMADTLPEKVSYQILVTIQAI